MVRNHVSEYMFFFRIKNTLEINKIGIEMNTHENDRERDWEDE